MTPDEAATILAEAKRYIKCTLCKGVRCQSCRGAICISQPARCDGADHCKRCLGVGALYNPKYVQACTVLNIPWDTNTKLNKQR